MTTITLEAVPDGVPAPYVSVAVDDHPEASARCTVWRTHGGRSFRVRGLVKVSTAGLVSGLDTEALFAESSYRVEYFDESGIFLEWSETEEVTLSGLEPGWAWMHDPFDPATSLKVRFEWSTAAEIMRSTPSDRVRQPSRSVGIAFAGTRSGVEGLVLDVWTPSFADADRLDAMLGLYDVPGPSILCVRTNRQMRIPATLFAEVPKSLYRPYGARRGSEHGDWSMAVDEVAPPVEAVIRALLDYADFEAYYTDAGGDYAAFTAAYADYAQAQVDYSIAGYADA